jgi:hypothetical protein
MVDPVCRRLVPRWRAQEGVNVALALVTIVLGLGVVLEVVRVRRRNKRLAVSQWNPPHEASEYSGGPLRGPK